MKKLFTALAAIFAAIPGLSIIVIGLGAPPEHKVLFGGVIESLGVLVLLIILFNKAKLQRCSVKQVTRTAVLSGLTFLLCLSAYSYLIRQCVFVSPLKNDKVFFPLWIRDKQLADEIRSRNDSRQQALMDLEDWVRRKLDSDKARSDASVSALILLLLYGCTTTSLVLAFALPGFYLHNQNQIARRLKES